MAGQGGSTGMGSGPGNKIIATTLLEWLAVRGGVALRDRAMRALETESSGLDAASTWLGDAAIASLFRVGNVDPALARAIGHRLVTPDATGLRLYGLGLATPEKAYRRVQSLLPRESARAHWHVESIEGRSAHLRFQPPQAAPPAGAERADGGSSRRGANGRTEAALCALRKGMLEAIPGLYGLLPAEVKESSCLASGGSACIYEVSWTTSPRSGLFEGLALGAGAAGGLAVSAIQLGAAPLSIVGPGATTFVVAVAAIVLGAAVGRIVDLRRQLEAVAGARRGHLALFDQVDDALAAKLDALARAEAKLEGEFAPNPVRRSAAPEVEGAGGLTLERQRGILAAAQQIHAAAGDLECWFDAQTGEGDVSGEGVVSDERGGVREIREWAARISELASPDGRPVRARVDLRPLVARAIATARPSLPSRAVVDVEAATELEPIDCEPFQIERVVAGLVRNAVEASVGLSETPRVVVHLAPATGGIELAVEDRGVGIDATEIDEVFDPFFADANGPARSGAGLAACLDIIERHGGALRIENEDRAGTRVSVWLPKSTEERTS